MMVQKNSLVVAILVMFLMGLSTNIFGKDSDAMEFTKDTPDAVLKNVKDGKAVLVDVRELVEWNAGHVRDAIHLPYRELQERKGEAEFLKKLPKDKIIYTYCAVGYRSSRAGKILAQQKFEVRPLKPGFEELAKAGFPVEKK